jgi:hypothetical protein
VTPGTPPSRPPSPLPTRTFQLVALATLPLPFAATWALWPYLPRFAEGSSVAFAGRVLVAVLALLGFVILWALALMPLRRRSTLPPLTQGLEGVSLGSIGAAYSEAERALHADATALTSAPRRRYHLRMAGAGALVALASAGVTAVMLRDPEGPLLLWFPVAAAVSVVLAGYHLIRGLLLRSE